jgi:hypothetical protein
VMEWILSSLERRRIGHRDSGVDFGDVANAENKKHENGIYV